MSDGITQIVVNFPTDVDPPDAFYKELCELISKVCEDWEDKHPDMVMWPAGIGARILWREPQEPDFDPTVFQIDVEAREAYESEIAGKKLQEQKRKIIGYENRCSFMV